MSIGLCIMVREVTDSRNHGMSAFGSWLDDEMKRRGLNQVRMEELSGVPNATISRILKGARPEPVNIAKIAKAFGEEPAKLMILAGYPVGDPADPTEVEKALLVQVRSFPWLEELIPDILSLSPSNQALVQTLIRAMLGQQLGDEPPE